MGTGRVVSVVLAGAIASSVLWSVGAHVCAEETDGHIDVLVLRHPYGHDTRKSCAWMDEQLKSEWETKGFRVCEWHLMKGLLPPGEFRKFNVVVLAMLERAGNQWSTHGYFHDVYRKNLAVLKDWVKEGGGLFVIQDTVGSGGVLLQAHNRFLEDFDMKLGELQVRDEARIYALDEASPYSWTRYIENHPITEGAEIVFYPAYIMRWTHSYSTLPLRPRSEAWKVLVEGAESAGGFAITGKKYLEDFRKHTDDRKLFAVRDWGEGRVAVCGVNFIHLLGSPFYSGKHHVGEAHHGGIAGVALRAGDGEKPSHWEMIVTNTFRWLAAKSRQQGWGSYDPEKGPVAEPPTQPKLSRVIDWDDLEMPPSWRHCLFIDEIDGKRYWDQVPHPWLQPPIKHYKVLIGARTAYSDGRGGVSAYKEAAKRAGYDIVVFTETFEHIGKSEWEALVADCRLNTDAQFACVPGLDMPAFSGLRRLLIGQEQYPPDYYLTEDKQAMSPDHCMMFTFGFGQHTVVIAKPGTSPVVPELLKHFQGIAVYTYRDGKLMDNGFDAYQWQAAMGSHPFPFVVHEVYSPDEVRLAAETGYQQTVPMDSVGNAASYLRSGMAQFFTCPVQYYLSEGPVLRDWVMFNRDAGRPEDNRDRYRLALGVESDAPMKEATLYDGFSPARRWCPGKGEAGLARTLDGVHDQQHAYFVVAEDEQGRRLISPVMSTLTRNYHRRCSDRQNWLGAIDNYTGMEMRPFWLKFPTKNYSEGFWKHRQGVPGTMLCALLEFPFSGNFYEVTIGKVSQKYEWAWDWKHVACDAKPGYPTRPSENFRADLSMVRYENAKVEDMHFHILSAQIEALRALDPEIATPLYPELGEAGVGDLFYYRDPESGKFEKGALKPRSRRKNKERKPERGEEREWVDLPAGGFGGGVIALTDNLRVWKGRVGFRADKAPDSIPQGKVWEARYLLVGKRKVPERPLDITGQVEDILRYMGFAGKAPYRLELAQGKLVGIAYEVLLEAADYGVAGTVRGDNPYYDLPLSIAGLNDNWTQVLWLEDTGELLWFTGYENQGRAVLPTKADGDVGFYAGNAVICSDPDLYASIASWGEDRVRVEVHNPTGKRIEARVRTPDAVTGYQRLDESCRVEAGQSLLLEAKSP